MSGKVSASHGALSAQRELPFLRAPNWAFVSDDVVDAKDRASLSHNMSISLSSQTSLSTVGPTFDKKVTDTFQLTRLGPS